MLNILEYYEIYFIEFFIIHSSIDYPVLFFLYIYITLYFLTLIFLWNSFLYWFVFSLYFLRISGINLFLHFFTMNFQKTSLVLIFLFIWYSIWYFSYTFSQTITPTPIHESRIPAFQSKKIEEAYSYLEKYYYGFHERTDTEKEDALIDALTKSLGDKHTSYFNPKDAQEFTESLSWDFEWIGAVIKEHLKGIQIMKVLDNSPAKKNNLLKWDIITKINEKETAWMLADEAVDIIRGPKWTTVKLQILSWDIKKEVEIKRDTVIVPSIYSEVLSGSTLWYIEIGFFGENTTKEFTQAFMSLQWSGVTGIIIDGRNNGWWYLDSAVNIVSTMIPKNKVIVATRGIHPEENITYFSKKQKSQNTNIPILMIVNNMSASATEILAGALQDYDRAIIVWQKTYGKWSVQEPFLLSDGSMMKITIAKWFTPKDRWIDEKWIEPDIHIDILDEDYKSQYDRQLEGAKVILQDLITKTGTVADYKNNKENIESVLIKYKIQK